MIPWLRLQWAESMGSLGTWQIHTFDAKCEAMPFATTRLGQT